MQEMKLSPVGAAQGFFIDQEIIFVVDESPEGGYDAYALGHSIFTESESFEELRSMVRDAVACHFHHSEKKPSLIRLHLVKDEVISV